MRLTVGVSMMELLIVLTLISVISLFSFPALHQLTQNVKEKNIESIIIADLQEAQQLAIVKREIINVAIDKSQLVIWEKRSGKSLLVEKFNNLNGEIRMRAYPHYRGYLMFSSRPGQTSDNASIWYCRINDSRPAWVVTISKFGVVKANKQLHLHCG